MKKYLLIALTLLIAVGWYYLHELERTVRRAGVVRSMNSLLVTYQSFERTGRFTNEWPELHIYPFTNHYLLGGTSYQCMAAIDSWDKSASNVLAITTNKSFILLGENNGPVPLAGIRGLPDWFW